LQDPDWEKAGEISWTQAIENCVCMTAGSHLMDLYGALDHYLLPLTTATKFGKTKRSSPSGIGPFIKSESRWKMRSVFQRQTLKVREKTSLVPCQEIGLNATLKKDQGFRCREVIESRQAKPLQPAVPNGLA